MTNQETLEAIKQFVQRWRAPLVALLVFYTSVFAFSILRGPGADKSTAVDSQTVDRFVRVPLDGRETADVSGTLLHFTTPVSFVIHTMSATPLRPSSAQKVVVDRYTTRDEVSAVVIVQSVATTERGQFMLCGGYYCALRQVFNTLRRWGSGVPFGVVGTQILEVFVGLPMYLVIDMMTPNDLSRAVLVVDNATDSEKTVVVGRDASVQLPPKSQVTIVFLRQPTQISVRSASGAETEAYLVDLVERQTLGNDEFVLNIAAANRYSVEYVLYSTN